MYLRKFGDCHGDSVRDGSTGDGPAISVGFGICDEGPLESGKAGAHAFRTPLAVRQAGRVRQGLVVRAAPVRSDEAAKPADEIRAVGHEDSLPTGGSSEEAVSRFINHFGCPGRLVMAGPDRQPPGRHGIRLGRGIGFLEYPPPARHEVGCCRLRFSRHPTSVRGRFAAAKLFTRLAQPD